MFGNKRIVPWCYPINYSSVVKGLRCETLEEIKRTHCVIQTWLMRCPANDVPRFIPCTFEILSAIIENSAQSKALAIMRFLSLVADSEVSKSDLAIPAYSLAKKANLPDWVADMRNAIAHHIIPSVRILDLGIRWCLNRASRCWSDHLITQVESDPDISEIYHTCYLYGEGTQTLDNILSHKALIILDYSSKSFTHHVLPKLAKGLPNFLFFLRNRGIELFEVNNLSRVFQKCISVIFAILDRSKLLSVWLECVYELLDFASEDYRKMCSLLANSEMNGILRPYLIHVNWSIILDRILKSENPESDMVDHVVKNVGPSLSVNNLNKYSFISSVLNTCPINYVPSNSWPLSYEYDWYKVPLGYMCN